MQPKIKIHFVCDGNIYRSRLAEAYAKSLNIPDIEFSSSGVMAQHYPKNSIAPWAKNIARHHHITEHLSPHRVQTSNEQLQASSIIVFMRDDVYQTARSQYEFNDAISLIWSINDRENWRIKLTASQMENRIFKHIRSNVNQLVKSISQGGWIDIMSEQNQPLHFSLPLSVALEKNLWHRACHVIITAPDGRTLVQKRSKHIFYSPGLIDITLGGHLDPGESPADAIIREIREETGLLVHPTDLKLLETFKWSSYHPHYKRHTKFFIYTYHVALPENNPLITRQKSEVAKMLWLSPRQLRSLLIHHRLKSVGRLNYAHKYYSRVVALASA